MAEMNIAEIEKLLGNLKSEVDDLHPHLQGLFNRIKNINFIEYTHGPSEYGADFILTRQDDITGETRYIGVVAKNKGINQGAVEEVRNQIDECIKIKRPINNGTNSVRMNDVWVIANGNISNNAKEKIEQTTQMGGITYFDRNKLAGLIIRYNYIITDDLPTTISICLSKQSELAESLKRQSLGSGYFDSEKIFINQRVIKIESHHYAQNKRRQQISTPTSIETAVEDNPTLILYGEPGSGKSKMLQHILSHAAEVKQFKNTKIIPIFSTCQDVLERYDGKISNLILDFKKAHNLKKIDADIHYMVIIDGIDECDLTFDERQEIIEKWKKESAQENIKKLIFASRDRFEEKTLGIPIYRVAGLSGKEVINVIRKHLSAIDNVDRLVQDIQSSDIFSSLPKSPLALVILINLLKDKNGRNELPANLTDLFAKYAECTLGRWSTDVSEGMRQKRYEAANKILTLIAQHMVDYQLHQITEDEAKLHFEKYLNERNLGIEADDLFDYVIDHSNFVYVDDGIFQFRHRTFTEFFYSKAFSEDKLENLGGDVFDVQWSNILFFYIGHKKDCPELLEKINSITPQRESGKFLKAVNMANYLLAAYATRCLST